MTWHRNKVLLCLAALAFAWSGEAATRWQRGDEEGFWTGKALIAARVENVRYDRETWVMEADMEVLEVVRAERCAVPERLTVSNRLVRTNPAASFQPEAGEICLLCVEPPKTADGAWRIPPVVTPLLGGYVAARKLPADYAGDLALWREKIQPDNHERDGRNEEEMKAVLNRVVATEYCGDAIVAGVTQANALRGNAPVDGAGFVRGGEEDWPVVLGEMALEEFRRLQREGDLHDMAQIGRLLNMIVLLGRAKGNPEPAFSALLAMAEKSDSGWDATFFRSLDCAWINLSLAGEGASKALELGKFFVSRQGVDSHEFWWFADALDQCDAFARCPTEGGRAEIARFFCEASERCEKPETAFFIDRSAAGGHYYYPADDDPVAAGKPKTGVAGWKDSLQRRRLAERFEGVGENGGPLHGRVSVELAAEESELTDLKQVYGDWGKEMSDE